jgi:hypothetical protein
MALQRRGVTSKRPRSSSADTLLNRLQFFVVDHHHHTLVLRTDPRWSVVIDLREAVAERTRLPLWCFFLTSEGRCLDDGAQLQLARNSTVHVRLRGTGSAHRAAEMSEVDMDIPDVRSPERSGLGMGQRRFRDAPGSLESDSEHEAGGGVPPKRGRSRGSDVDMGSPFEARDSEAELAEELAGARWF